MRVEQSRVKIIVSKSDYDALMAARDVVLEMKETLEYEDLGGLDFYQELLSLEDSLTTLECDFESTKYGDYVMEVE